MGNGAAQEFSKQETQIVKKKNFNSKSLTIKEI